MVKFLHSILHGQGPGARLVRGGSGAMSFKIGSAFLAFATTILLARFMGLESFGKYVFVLGWTQVLMYFGRMGFTSLTIRYIPRYLEQPESGMLRGLLRRSLQLPLIASTMASVVMVIAAALILTEDRELRLTFYFGGVLVVLRVLVDLLASRLQVMDYPVQSLAIRQTYSAALILIASVILRVTWGEDLPAHVVMMIHVGALLTMVLLELWMLRGVFPVDLMAEPAKFATRHWLRIAITLTLIGTMQTLLTRLDTIMVGSMRSTDDAGIYGAASHASEIILMAWNSLIIVAMPMISRYYAAGDMPRMIRTCRLVSLVSLGFSLPAMIVMILWGREILFLYGPAFAEGYSVLVILLVGRVIFAACAVTGVTLSMTRHETTTALVFAAALVLNVVLNLVLIPRWGMEGAAVATTCGFIMLCIALTALCVFKLKCNPTILPPYGQHLKEANS